jgi:hypothetical protein
VPQTSTEVLLVNFDPYIFEVIKESEYMIKLNLEIPDAARTLVHSREKLKAHVSQMKVCNKIFLICFYRVFDLTISFTCVTILQWH